MNTSKLKKTLQMNKKRISLYSGIAISLLLLTTCDVFNPGLGPSIDINAPRIGIDSHINGAYISGPEVLTGYYEDDTTINSLRVVGGGIDVMATYSNGDWSANIETTLTWDHDNNGLTPEVPLTPDGEHEYTITAIDSAGKESLVKIYLIVDNGPPSVLVTTPANYATRDFNKTIAIKGEATDTTRVDSVRVSMYDSSLPDPISSPIFEDELATGTTSWYYTYDSTLLPTGPYFFFVEAEDKSGNTNSYFYHFDDLLGLAFDPANTPNIEEVHAEDHEGVDNLPGLILSADLDTIRKTRDYTIPSELMEINVDPNSDDPQFTFISPSYSLNPADNVLAAPQRLSGFVEDDDGINGGTLEIALWNYADDPAVITPPSVQDWTAPTLSGNQWSFDTALSDGEYWMELRVADIYGTSATSDPASFRVSSFAPVVTITAPAQGSYVGLGSTVTLEAHVTGMGSGTVEVDPDGDGDYSDAIAMVETPPGSDDYQVDLDEGAAADFELLIDGQRSFKIRAGTLGNYGTASLQYTGDVTAPTVSVDVPPPGASVNGTFNILGTSSDNNLVSSVYLWIEEDAAPDLPADPLTWLTPDTSDVYNWISEIITTGYNTGAHTIHVTAFDAAGNRSAPYSSAFDIDQESDRPVVYYTNLTEGGVALDNSLGQDAEFIGYIEDDDSVDRTTIEVLIDVNADGLNPPFDYNGDLAITPNESEAWQLVSDPPGSNGRIVNWSHSIADLPQGEHAMWIRVFDVDDVTGVTVEATNPNYAETLETRFIVDYGPPTLVITAPSNNSIFNSTFDIEGTATDPNKITDVDISFNAGAFGSIFNNPLGTILANWSYTFDVDPAGADDGDYAYQVRATDLSGGISTLDRQLIVDATEPTVIIEQPGDGGTVNGPSVLIRGTSDDRSVIAVYVDINPTGTGPTPDPLDPTTWDYTASGTYSWSQTFDSLVLDGDQTPSDWDIAIKALDNAGNYSDDTADVIKDLITITIDQTSDRPIITFNDIDKDETVASNNVLVGATTLTGLVEDDDLIDPALFSGDSIEIWVDSDPWTAVSNPPSTTGKVVVWRHDISGLTEGIHYVKVRARDNQSDGTIGNSSTSDEYITPGIIDFNWNIEDSTDQGGVPFILNLGPPALILSNPLNYSYHNSNVTVDGTAIDANGVDTVEISLDNGSTWIDLGVTPGISIPWSYVLTVDGTNDGTYSYLIRATDTYGSSGIENGQFTVDATVPDAVINQPSSSDTVNGIMNFTGTASDNISLSKVYYNIQPTASPLPAYPGDYTEFSGNYSWNDNFDTTAGPSPDVSHTLRVVAEDTAGNTSDTVTPISVVFTVDQSSDRPVISYSSITETGTFTENLLPGAKQIAGTIIDDDGVDAATVEYQLYDETGLVLLTAITPDWTPVSGQPAINSTLATWTHTFGAGVTDGKYQVKIRAADTFDSGAFAAGGFGWSESPLVKLAVDTANPETTITSPASNGSYTNQDFTVSGTATDAGGIKKVEIQFDSDPTIILIPDIAPYNSSEAWTYTFDVDEATNSDDGIIYYTITITDAYDKIKTLDRYINIDTQDPVINALTLVNNDQTGGGVVNGSALVQGSPNDYETLVDGIYLRIATGAAPAEPGSLPTVPGGDPVLDWILLGSTTNLNYRFNTADYADSTAFTAYIIIQDQAGNRTAVGDYTVDFTPIQAGNTPVITIDTADNSLLRNSDSITGSIIDDDGVDVSTIEISFDGGGTWTPVTSKSASNSTSVTFSHSMASIPEQAAAYSVQIQADDIGEFFVDASQNILPVSELSSIISVNVDDTDPTAAITLIDNGKNSSPTVQGIYINDQFTLTGTAADGVQVQEVRAMLTGEAFTDVPITTSDGYANWTWTRTGLSIGSDSTVMTLEVEDVHGRITTYSYTLLVDETLPTISFITTAGTYHGSIDIRGTSSDNVLVSDVYIAEGATVPAAPAGGDPATDVNYTPLGSTYSWTYTLDTTVPNNTDVDSNYHVSVVAVDGAGNLSAKQDLSFIINQGSDRPSITFTNVDPLVAADINLLESNAKVLGSADDDDGLASIEIATSADGFATYSPITTDGTTQVVVSGLNLNWQSFVADLGEGIHTVRFRVRDTLYATTLSTFNEIISADIPITIDTGAPTVSIDDFVIDDPYSAGTVNKAAAAGILINNAFIVSGTATDGNTISNVEISTDGSTFTTVDTPGNSWSHSVSIVRDGNGTDDGTLTIYITATDQFSKSTTISLPVTIDTLEPEITPTQPAGIDLADPPNVNGPVTLRGSIAEVSAISSFAADGGSPTSISIPNSGSDLNWVLDIDTDLYASSLYATETGVGTDVWRFPIDINAEDAAGNTRAETYHIDIDPDSDKPFIFLTAPADTSSVAGAFIVQGTVTDDDDIQKVTIQVDLDNDGLYTSGYDLDGIGGIGNSDFENEWIPVDVTVTNGSWNILMNQSNEFNKNNLITAGFAGADGNIGLKVIPYDIDNSRSGSPNLAGDPAEISIYVDSTLPIIEGQGQALPSPDNGSIVKDTVTVEARFKDDSLLTNSRMQVSYDGGQSFQAIETAGGTITANPANPVGDYYEYDISLPIDTTTGGGIVTGGNGILQAVLKVTDETFKQNSMALQLNADNTLPTGIWNYNNSLTDQAGIFTFYGNETAGGEYLLIGSAEDTGTISGVERVEAYFVKNGRFYNPSVDNSGGFVDAPLVGANTSAIPDMTGTPQTIPYTTDANYVINVDNRAERGIYDDDPTDGDNDGFQESLRSKGIYDEWFVYFDTELFPDGPIDLYYVVYDTAGNMAYEMVSSQISNNPPSITQVDVGTNAGSANPYTGLFKQSNSLYIDVSATDVEGIDTATYKATLVNKVVAPNGAISTDGPALNTVWPLGTDGTGTIDVQEDPATAFVSGVQYTLELEVRDTDGNIITYPIEFWLDNNDITLPKVDIDPFNQGHLSGLNGHLEEDGNSDVNGTDADISGTILITGVAWDDNTVGGVDLSFDGGSTWVATDTLAITSSDPILGTNYDWSYVWDSTENHGVITEDAAYDRTISVRATDSNANIGTLNDSGGDPTMTVDVVPYITGITGTGFDTGLLTFVKRSAAGNYPIVVGSTITVNGYNLPGTSGNAFSIGGTDLTAVSATGSTSMNVDLLATDTSGDIIVTTAGVPSANNGNDNSLPQNEEDNSYNANLDDDRSGVFWDVSSLAGTSNVTDPAMHPNAADSDYDWMYVKNGKDLFLLPGGSAEEKLTGGTGLSGGDFTYNDDGTLMFLYNHDAQWSFADNSYRFTGGVQWGAIPNLAGFNFTADRDEAYNWNHDEGIPKVSLGNVSFNDAGGTLPNTPGIGDLSYAYTNLDLNRFKNLIVRTVGGDTATRNYVAYFDSGALESRSIVFYAFKTGTTAASVQGGIDLYYGSETAANKLDPWIPMATDLGTAVSGTSWFANIDKHFMSADDYSVSLTGNQLNNDTGIATPRGRQEVTIANAGNDSEDFDLGVHVVSATEHHGFIAYFDESSSSLKITANESLYTADPTGTLGAWTAPFTVDTNSGADVAIAVDPDGGIHLAYQDVSAGYLKYSYLTYNSATDTFSLVEQEYVDALFGAGANNSIAVRDFGTGDYRPVILTFSSAYTGTIAPLRMSYPFYGPGDVSFGAGADSSTGAFLGNWETIALPASSNPVALKNYLYVDSTGDVQIGYKGSNLEEAGYRGF